MPTYDYQCNLCKAVREEHHKGSESPIIYCYPCENEMTMVFLVAPLMRMAGTSGGKWVGDSSVYTKQLKRKKKQYFTK